MELKPPPKPDWAVFTEELRRIAKRDIDDGIDLALSHLDDLAATIDGLQEIDSILRGLNACDIPNAVIYAVLSITFLFKHRLSERADFFDDAFETVAERDGEEHARALLENQGDITMHYHEGDYPGGTLVLGIYKHGPGPDYHYVISSIQKCEYVPGGPLNDILYTWEYKFRPELEKIDEEKWYLMTLNFVAEPGWDWELESMVEGTEEIHRLH